MGSNHPNSFTQADTMLVEGLDLQLLSLAQSTSSLRVHGLFHEHEQKPGGQAGCRQLRHQFSKPQDDFTAKKHLIFEAHNAHKFVVLPRP